MESASIAMPGPERREAFLPTTWPSVERAQRALVQRDPAVSRNAPAVIGATVGCLSLVLSLLPVVGLVAWVSAPLGVVLSAAGLAIGSVRKSGRLGAMLGLGTSLLALALSAAWLLLITG